MNIKDEYEYVKKLPREIKGNYLKNNSFRKRLFTSEGHYPFVWLVQELEGDELLYLLDDDLIPFLLNDERLSDKLNAIMTCGNSYNNLFLKKEKIIEAIYNNSNSLKIFLRYLDKEFAKNYLNYLLSIGDLSSFSYLNPSIQLEMLKNSSNFEKIKSLKLDSNFFIELSKEAIEYLFNDKYFENLFLDMNIYNISYVIKKGVTLPNYLINSNILINKYLSIDNIIIFLEFLTDLEKNNAYLKDILKDKKKQEYDDKVRNYSIEDKELLELIIVFNYEEIPYNFLKNVSSIISYIKQIDKILIPTNRYQIYEKLINFSSLTKDDKIKLYHEIGNNKNAMAEFYDDFKTCLNDSYKDIKDSVTDINNLKSYSLSSKYGVCVYELNGEPFKFLINHTRMNRDNLNHHSAWNSLKKYASLSVISNTCFGTYRSPYSNVIVGFNQFDYMNIAHVYHSDSYTSNEFGSKSILELYTIDNLLRNTKGYNEILMKNSNLLKPSCIICYDEIKLGDVEASKILGNIPLVLLYTNKYNVKYTCIDTEDNDYLRYTEASIISKKGR